MLRALTCGCTMILVLLHCAVLSQAATVYLKNGKKVEGTIVKRTQDAVYVGSSEEYAIPYWFDEIERIEGADPTTEVPSGASPSNHTDQTAPARQLEWSEFTSTKGGFHVLMPGHLTEPAPPTEEQGTVVAKQGGFTCIVDYVTVPKLIWNMTAAEQKPSIAEAANDAKEGARQKGLQLVSERELSLNGHPGYELAFRSEKTPMMLMRMYVVGPRRYDLAVTVGTQEDYAAETSKFFDSFTLVTP